MFADYRRPLLLLTLFALMALGAAEARAGGPKVDVCHVPPGNPTNFHTIRINQNALLNHLGHGDFSGACNDYCAQLCDDGNLCTIDDTGDCEDQGCPTAPVPVDCSDSSLCTDDLCDPATGCSNPEIVTCTGPDLCTASVCDPLTGTCEETPLLCDTPTECDPSTGDCVCEDIACPPGQERVPPLCECEGPEQYQVDCVCDRTSTCPGDPGYATCTTVLAEACADVDAFAVCQAFCLDRGWGVLGASCPGTVGYCEAPPDSACGGGEEDEEEY